MGISLTCVSQRSARLFRMLGDTGRCEGRQSAVHWGGWVKSCYLEQMKQRGKTLHCVCRQHGRVGGWRTCRRCYSVSAIKTAILTGTQRREKHEKRWTAKLRKKPQERADNGWNSTKNAITGHTEVNTPLLLEYQRPAAGHLTHGNSPDMRGPEAEKHPVTVVQSRKITPPGSVTCINLIISPSLFRLLLHLLCCICMLVVFNAYISASGGFYSLTIMALLMLWSCKTEHLSICWLNGKVKQGDLRTDEGHKVVVWGELTVAKMQITSWQQLK